jgi:hypothetical protein
MKIQTPAMLFFCTFCAFLRLFPSSLCAFASLADTAKGGDGAKSALREIFQFVGTSSPSFSCQFLSGKTCLL